MPRAALADTGRTAPLTVSAVADRLGIRPATLRTWDRRYGLGPSAHSAGAHRRYSMADIARLERVRELVLSGVTVSDAASMVTAEIPVVVERNSNSRSETMRDLVANATSGNYPQVHSQIERSVADIGLVRTWCTFVEPAIEELRSRTDGDVPGKDPFAVLQTAVLNVVDRVVTQPCPNSPCAVRVLLCVDRAHRIQAHVVGAALSWRGIDARILTVRSAEVARLVHEHLADRGAGIVVIVGPEVCTEELIEHLGSCEKPDVLLVGPDVPCVLAPHITRVRTLTAAVDEIDSLARFNSGRSAQKSLLR